MLSSIAAKRPRLPPSKTANSGVSVRAEPRDAERARFSRQLEVGGRDQVDEGDGDASVRGPSCLGAASISSLRKAKSFELEDPQT
jgi:hypothetical protein